MSPDEPRFSRDIKHHSDTICRYLTSGQSLNNTRLTGLIIALMMILLPINVSAVTFRVTTEVFSDKGLDPTSKHLILFQEGVIYDFPQLDSRFVTIFDAGKKIVTIMDRENQVQTSVTEDDLVKITAQARSAATTDDQRSRLGINAVVSDSRLVQGYTLSFGSLEYHVTGQKAPSDAVATEFAKFVDLAARLNLVRRLGPPPFGRMTLNQYLAEKKEIPLETILIIKREAGSQKYRSKLLLEPLENLSESDLKKVKEVAGMRVVYRQVDLKSFPSP